MSALSVLIGFKGGVAVVAAPPASPSDINAAFKIAALSNGKIGDDQFDELQVLDSRTGRTRRKRFAADPTPAPKPKSKSDK